MWCANAEPKDWSPSAPTCDADGAECAELVDESSVLAEASWLSRGTKITNIVGQGISHKHLRKSDVIDAGAAFGAGAGLSNARGDNLASGLAWLPTNVAFDKNNGQLLFAVQVVVNGVKRTKSCGNIRYTSSIKRVIEELGKSGQVLAGADLIKFQAPAVPWTDVANSYAIAEGIAPPYLPTTKRWEEEDKEYLKELISKPEYRVQVRGVPGFLWKKIASLEYFIQRGRTAANIKCHYQKLKDYYA